MTSIPKIRADALERDFHVLFGDQSTWEWPFFDDGFISGVFSLGITTFIAQIVIGIFVHIKESDWEFLGLAAIVFLSELIRKNYSFMSNRSVRQRLRAKYLPIIEQTEAYDLLMDALASRDEGVIKGAENKEQSDEMLLKLWKVCFAEAEQIEAPFNTTGLRGDILDQRPVAEVINSYLSDRKQAHLELES